MTSFNTRSGQREPGLITTPANLSRLVENSARKRNRKLDAVKDMELTALGALANFYEREESPENLEFGLFATLIPSMVSSSPAADLRSQGGRKERVQAAALASAVTQICAGTKMHRALEPCAWDILFKPFCAGFVEVGEAQMSDLTSEERKAAAGRLAEEFGRERVEDESDDGPHPRANASPSPSVPPHWARFKRLNPKHCGWDMDRDTFDEARFTFHSVTEDRELLVRRADADSESWHPLAVRMAARVHSASGDNHGHAGTQEDYVKYYVIYVRGGVLPDTPPKRNQPGVIYTISSSGIDRSGANVSGMELREPYYFEGPPDGPHVFGGQYTTGYDSMFLNLLAANEDAITMLKAVSSSVHQRIRDHKVVTAFRAVDIEDVQKVADARHSEYVAVNTPGDLSQIMQQVETNALTPAEVAEYREMQINANRQLGISDATTGFANADATATAVNEAAAATDVKVEYLIERWNRFVGEAMERLAFYAATDDRIFVRLDDTGRASVLRSQLEPLAEAGVLQQHSVEAIVEAEKNTPMVFQGGDFNLQNGELDWYSLRLEVKPNSMTGSQSRATVQRQLAWNQQLAFLAQQMLTTPFGRWADRIRETGRAMGINEAELAVDVALAEAMAQAQMAAPTPSYGTVGTSGWQPPRSGHIQFAPQPQEGALTP